jgi:hypothetical protein
MPGTKIDLARQAIAKFFSFGASGAGNEGRVTVERGAQPASFIVIDANGSVDIEGDLSVSGKITYLGQLDAQSVTNTNVADKTITLNDGGTTAGASGGGIHVEGDSGAVVGAIRYDTTKQSKFTVGDGTTQREIVDVAATQTLQNKTLDSAVHTGTPTAPTATAGDSSTKLATTQFVQDALTGLTSNPGFAGAVSQSNPTGTSITLSHTVPANNRRLLVVKLWLQSSADTVSAMTYGGAAMTRVVRQVGSGSDGALEIWILVAPAVGTANVVVTKSASAPADFIQAVNYKDIDQTTPVDVAGGVSATGTGLAATVNITPVTANAIIVDAVHSSNAGQAPTVGAGQTVRGAGGAYYSADYAMGSEKVLAVPGTTSMSWTIPSSVLWILAAVALRPAAGIGGGTSSNAKTVRKTTVTGTQDGTNKVFTIGNALDTDSEIVTLNGVILDSGSSNDYILSGTTLTFQAAFDAPTATDKIAVRGAY